jgi:hypothetical protein
MKTSKGPRDSATASLKARITELEKQLDASKQMWLKEAQKSGPLMSAQFELLKTQKQLRIIQSMAQQKWLEAISELLDPNQVCFNIEVVYGDDKTRVAAQTEMLEQVKKKLNDTIASCTIAQSGERGKAESVSTAEKSTKE